MNRLQTELHRLYDPTADDGPLRLLDDHGRTRALVLEVTGPPDGAALQRLWQGVQAELDWPAPAPAVSGQDSLQLWFSLAQPLTAAQAQALGQALQRRWLADLAPRRVRCWPRQDGHTAPVPLLQADGSNWSAFVAPDLLPLFADTPWLDLPPGDDGQAQLLAPLRSVSADRVAAALPVHAEPPVHAAAAAGSDPRQFLQSVMNDADAPLALRVEAAKALLAHAPAPGG
jgi:hypothetical protein